jgi:hypothetical protein
MPALSKLYFISPHLNQCQSYQPKLVGNCQFFLLNTDRLFKVAVNFANWLTRMWKFAPEVVGRSEFLLHTNVLTIIEFDEDIFAGGNCYDADEYKSYYLFCPYAYRMPGGALLAKDLGRIF